MSSDGLWPKWGESATKGDLIRVAVYQRAINIKLSDSLSSVMNGDLEKARKYWNEYLEANEDLLKLVDEIGGGRGGE